jgi:hypothetical protein
MYAWAEILRAIEVASAFPLTCPETATAAAEHILAARLHAWNFCDPAYANLTCYHFSHEEVN